MDIQVKVLEFFGLYDPYNPLLQSGLIPIQGGSNRWNGYACIFEMRTASISDWPYINGSHLLRCFTTI